MIFVKALQVIVKISSLNIKKIQPWVLTQFSASPNHNFPCGVIFLATIDVIFVAISDLFNAHNHLISPYWETINFRFYFVIDIRKVKNIGTLIEHYFLLFLTFFSKKVTLCLPNYVFDQPQHLGLLSKNNSSS